MQIEHICKTLLTVEKSVSWKRSSRVCCIMWKRLGGLGITSCAPVPWVGVLRTLFPTSAIWQPSGKNYITLTADRKHVKASVRHLCESQPKCCGPEKPKPFDDGTHQQKAFPEGKNSFSMSLSNFFFFGGEG